MMTLGHKRNGKPLRLSPVDRSLHMHVIGTPRSGKSSFLQHMIREDILAERGVCVIDPHGTLAEPIIEFCASRRIHERKRVHIIDPNSPEWCAGFNPLRLDPNTNPHTRVDAMVEACAQVWGGADMSATPLLKKCLKAVFYALLIRELTLAEAQELISSTGRFRKELTKNLPDYVYDGLWQEFNALSRREFVEQFSSTTNRLTEFLGSDLIRRIVGQQEHALDFRRIMDEGDIVICNFALKGTLSEDSARIIGTLITRELFLLAKTRDVKVAERRPFYLYIDECYDFLTEDVLRMLDQTRKFGLHVILAHHHLGQLRSHGQGIYDGVMAGAANRVVFRLEHDEDAQILALQVMREHIDLERPKHSLDKPVVVDEVPFWLDSESESWGEGEVVGITESDSWSASAGVSESAGEGYRVSVDQPPQQISTSASIGSFNAQGESGGYARTETSSSFESTTQGRSQTLKPVREVMPTAVHSLDEEVHRLVLQLTGLPQRVAMAKPAGRTAVRIETPFVSKVYIPTALTESFVAKVSAASPYVTTIANAEAEIAARRQKLLTHGVATETDEDFWHEAPERPVLGV